MARLFLLSPANCSGPRLQQALAPGAQFDLARKLREGGAALGEVFAFASALYFRGKRAYGRAFATPPPGVPGVLVIAPGFGLLPEDTPVTVAHLRAMAEVPVDAAEPRYLAPLARDAKLLDDSAPHAEIVLLGSVAAAKYVDPLTAVFGARLLFPDSFVGRGDMSRGGLLLRCVRAGEELSYVPVQGAVRRGKRPPKLPRLRR